MHALPHPVGAVYLCVNRALHVVRGHDAVAGHARPVVRLAQQIRNAQQMDGKLAGVSRHAGAALDDARDGSPVEGTQILAARHRGDQAGVQQVALGGALHVLIEIGLDLEQLAKVGVELDQRII